MTHKKEITLLGFILAVLLIGLLAWAVQPAAVQAQGGLPDRERPAPADDSDHESSGPGGAHIELHAPGAPAGAWSVVQWQNGLGDWYDVEGWQGTLDANGMRRWWVHEKDFRDGPFRWAVTQGKGGSLLGASRQFYLPTIPNKTVRVTVSLAK